jgi:hypothetical protein
MYGTPVVRPSHSPAPDVTHDPSLHPGLAETVIGANFRAGIALVPKREV